MYLELITAILFLGGHFRHRMVMIPGRFRRLGRPVCKQAARTRWKSRASHTVEVVPSPNFLKNWDFDANTSSILAGWLLPSLNSRLLYLGILNKKKKKDYTLEKNGIP